MIRSKYKAKPVVIDGIRFASGAEGHRYRQLKLMEQARAISRLECHPSFVLTAPNTSGGSDVVGKYIADFRYEQGGRCVVEDVKGKFLDLAKWKVKHFEIEYGQKVRIITNKSQREAWEEAFEQARSTWN